jgi:hypothetical protein
MGGAAAARSLGNSPNASLDVSLRSTVRARTLTLEDGSVSFINELEVVPQASMVLNIPRFAFTLGLSPRFLVVSLQGGPVEIYTSAWLLLEYKIDPTWRLFAAENASYGTNNLTLPATAPGSPAQPPPQLAPFSARTSIPYIYLSSSLGLVGRLSRRTTLALTGSYVESGGVGAAAEQTMPLQWGPRAEASVDWKASREQSLVTAGTAQLSTFSVGRTVYTGTLTETLRSEWDRRFRTTFTLGAGSSNTETLTGYTFDRVAPVLGLGMDMTTAARDPLHLALNLYVGPYVDPFLAVAYQRATLTGNLDWRLRRDWTLGANLSAAVTPYKGRVAERYGVAGLSASYAASRTLLFSTGTWIQWQLDNLRFASAFRQGGIYVSLTVRDSERL